MGNKLSNPDEVQCVVTKDSDTVVKMKDSVVKSSATVDEEMKDSEVQATVLPKKELKVTDDDSKKNIPRNAYYYPPNLILAV